MTGEKEGGLLYVSAISLFLYLPSSLLFSLVQRGVYAQPFALGRNLPACRGKQTVSETAAAATLLALAPNDFRSGD